MNANVYGCDRQRVYMLVKEAVKNGDLIKPEICSNCPSKKQIEAHHTDYNKPLEVTWLCKKCHCEESVYAKQTLVNV